MGKCWRIGFQRLQEEHTFAAQMAAETAAKAAMEHGLKTVEVYVKGPVLEEKLQSELYRQPDLM